MTDQEIKKTSTNISSQDEADQKLGRDFMWQIVDIMSRLTKVETNQDLYHKANEDFKDLTEKQIEKMFTKISSVEVKIDKSSDKITDKIDLLIKELNPAKETTKKINDYAKRLAKYGMPLLIGLAGLGVVYLLALPAEQAKMLLKLL